MTLAVATKLTFTSLSQYMLLVKVTVKMTVVSPKPQVSFTEHLGMTDWCKCTNCMSMPSGRKCQRCQKKEGLHEHLTGDNSVTVSRTMSSLKWLV